MWSLCEAILLSKETIALSTDTWGVLSQFLLKIVIIEIKWKAVATEFRYIVIFHVVKHVIFSNKLKKKIVLYKDLSHLEQLALGGPEGDQRHLAGVGVNLLHLDIAMCDYKDEHIEYRSIDDLTRSVRRAARDFQYSSSSWGPASSVSSLSCSLSSNNSWIFFIQLRRYSSNLGTDFYILIKQICVHGPFIR